MTDDVHAALSELAAAAAFPPLDLAAMQAAARGRRHRRRFVVGSALAAAVVLAVPLAWASVPDRVDRVVSAPTPAPREPVTGTFVVSYFGDRQYDEAAATRAREACDGTPGLARTGYVMLSAPPQFPFSFTGTLAELQDARTCLERGPGAFVRFTQPPRGTTTHVVGLDPALDPSTAEQALATCGRLPRVERGAADLSDPPQHPFTLANDDTLIAGFQKCVEERVGGPVTVARVSGLPPSADGRDLQVFFSPPDVGSSFTAGCTEVVAVSRRVPATEAVAAAALQELFRGPTAEERARGLVTFFGPETADLLAGVRIADGTAYVDLRASLLTINNVSTTCGSAIFDAQVRATLQQFSTVQAVLYAVEGDPAAYYEQMQLSCPQALLARDRCSAGRFRG